jgi:hypothetical protein
MGGNQTSTSALKRMQYEARDPKELLEIER